MLDSMSGEFAAQSDFASHRRIAADRMLCIERGQRRRDGHSGRGAIFRDGAGRNVDVDSLRRGDVKRLTLGKEITVVDPAFKWWFSRNF